ncbi:MAG: bifunctional folylpolyglutamate synthase/dihydrofolate synthase [Acidobacteria bacterium]|nr:bifunctional folylpolyglutamate synthase/dihydrofolate synthase [Acidobacteriota bacterium]
MDYQTAIDYLYSLGHETLAMKLGLENISCLINKMGNPHQTYSSIHVAGTNGKGSFCKILATILVESSISTALFTSPHLMDLTERFQYSLKPISINDFCQILSEIKLTIDNLLSEKSLLARPTFFEHVTAIALEYFRKCQARVAVLEVGLGGRLDSTNIVTPILSVITSIDFDHQQYLGNTLSNIAREKAGILKKGVPALIAPQQKEVKKVIEEVAEKVGSPLIWLEDKDISATYDRDGYWKINYLDKDLILGLRGKHQVMTAKLAICAIELLNSQGFSITLDNITSGLKNTNWPGRLELLNNQPDILLDGAHNPHGVDALREFLSTWLIEKQYPTKVLIFSTMQDKDFSSMTKNLFPLFDIVVLVNRNDPRAKQFSKIDGNFSLLSKEIIIAENVDKALKIAKEKAKINGLITISGSLHLIGEVKKLLKENFQPFEEKIYGI